MNEVREKLTPAERAILSDLWENKDLLRALQSALSHRQLWLAQFSALTATDMNQVMHSRGQIAEDNWFVGFLKHNFKEGEKARKAAEAAGK
ncbi:MAG TPA: hypothetical protein VFL85_01550 [Candidatus Saccharimonadales bacterium]|nr:hypothetical protein [Candidatus Saccharimonadales bacterium]